MDGQQRLVTLSLILWGLGYKGNIPLLNERFRNNDAIKHIKNAKAVISALLRELRSHDMLDAVLDSLKFSVIVINDDNLDIGYTFFSNQNSKGVKLTDYDLLKARIEELGMREEDYGFYMDLRKYGSTRHAGFGLGFERCVMYLTGISNIRDVLPFPRTVGNCEL